MSFTFSHVERPTVGRLLRKPTLGSLAVLLIVGHLVWLSYAGKVAESWDREISPDALQYVTLAGNLVEHGQFTLDGNLPSARREPGYVAFIAPFVSLGMVRPHDPTFANMWPVLVCQILLYGVVSWGLALFSRRQFGPLAGLLCLLFTQVWWGLFVYQHRLLSECLTMVILAVAWLWIGDWQRLKSSWATLVGGALLLGYACLTKSIFVMTMPLLVLLMWLRGGVPFFRSAVFAVVVLAMPLAWTARNYHHFGLPIMGSIDGVSSMYRGNVLPFTQIPSPDEPEMPKEAKTALAGMTSDVEKYQWYKAQAMEIIREHPVRYVLQCMNRLVFMVTDYDVATTPAWHAMLLFKNDQFVIMLLLGLYFPTLLRQNRRDFYVEGALLMFLASLSLYALVYGETRYIMPWVFVMTPLYATAFAQFIAEPLLRRLVPLHFRNTKCFTGSRIGGADGVTAALPVEMDHAAPPACVTDSGRAAMSRRSRP